MCGSSDCDVCTTFCASTVGEDMRESFPCGVDVPVWSLFCVKELWCVFAAMLANATAASFRRRRGLCSDDSSPCMMRIRRSVHVVTCARPPRSIIGRMHACEREGSCAWSAAVSMPSVYVCTYVCMCICMRVRGRVRVLGALR